MLQTFSTCLQHAMHHVALCTYADVLRTRCWHCSCPAGPAFRWAPTVMQRPAVFGAGFLGNHNTVITF